MAQIPCKSIIVGTHQQPEPKPPWLRFHVNLLLLVTINNRNGNLHAQIPSGTESSMAQIPCKSIIVGYHQQPEPKPPWLRFHVNLLLLVTINNRNQNLHGSDSM
ncbi:hypothetical protein J6590_096689 [Homalodisca vitripennis]|nr:hypothetical protein J6590_096689 [Homalodisca vitripennis]